MREKFKKQLYFFDNFAISSGVSLVFLLISFIFLYSFEGFPISLVLTIFMALGLSFIWMPAVIIVIGALVFWKYKKASLGKKLLLILINLILFAFFVLLITILFFLTPFAVVDNLAI